MNLVKEDVLFVNAIMFVTSDDYGLKKLSVL